jgi:S1-C subfamily serine protease
MLDGKFSARRAALVRLLLALLLLAAVERASGQASNPVEVGQALREVSPLIVMITADSGDGSFTKQGTGVIIGYDDTSVYVITADHVVWNGTTPSPRVTLEIMYTNGDDAPIRNVQVLRTHEPPYVGQRQGLDLAVLRFDRAAYKMPLDELSFRVLGRSGELKDQEKMYSVGYADNGTKWHLNPLPERFSRIDGFVLIFGSTSVTPGYSGGPLFNSKFQLVGLISEDAPQNTGKAITIEAIVAKLREWATAPVMIAPGPGRVIIGEADRGDFPLTDAIASVSILLPVDSPNVKPFVDKTAAAVRTFAAQNPRYDNERPRELYYTSYSEQGRRRVPDVVTIYTDSPYWPVYSQEPLVTLLARIQGTGLHFYRSPIDPRSFNPDNPNADLSMGFGKNYVKYTTLERQLQAEQNYGRLELQQSLPYGTLEQFGWNMRSEQSGWRTNGSIVSLLDLRGAQLIISTVVGNLGNREDLRSAFDEARAQTRLKSLILSFGKRSLEFNERNTRRFIDRKGNPYYVFDFPRTSQELLKVFQP